MKKKTILICSGLLFCIVTILVLLFTVFTVKNVEFTSHNNTSIDTTNIQVDKGGVVFFLDKKQIKQKIQQQNQYLKIINIEIKFPNTLVVHFAQREETFVVKDNRSETYYILDEDFYVLQILNMADYQSTQTNSVLLSSENFDFEGKDIRQGDKLDFLENAQLCCNLVDSFLLNNRDISEIKALIKKAEIQYDSVQKVVYDDPDVICLWTFDDFLIKIYAPNTKLAEKIQSALASLSHCIPDYCDTHYLEVLQNLDGEIFCKLSIKS